MVTFKQYTYIFTISINWTLEINFNSLFLGDEVVEWNGRSLQGKTFEEVYEIIFESKQEPQVELIVRRTMR